MLSVKNLHKTFLGKRKGLSRARVDTIKAVNGVDLKVRRGETHALVGESGSGKTTLGKTAIRIYSPTNGAIMFDGRDITHLSGQELKAFRREAQMMFQDPTSSLNPRKSVFATISLPLNIYGNMSRRQRKLRIEELLATVELPRAFRYRYPYSLSGGQKQRVGLARALATQPSLIVLDEPTSALDVSVQAKILSLLANLQQEHELTYLYITHDLAIVRNIATTTSVMYLGRIVERAKTENLFTKPRHPYTKALLSAIPIISETENRYKPVEVTLEGDIPSPSNIPKHCGFFSRCQERLPECKQVDPALVRLENDHWARCLLFSNTQGNE
jgi:oligopeptide/dipeptide ABC transporter ATP-binding protein